MCLESKSIRIQQNDADPTRSASTTTGKKYAQKKGEKNCDDLI
jgi:hypothetical protein